MCRGGGPELGALSASIANAPTPAAGLPGNSSSLTDTFLMPSALGNNPYSFQGGMNPALFAAQRSNMNFPIPLNNGMSSQFPGQGMGMAAAAAGMPPGAHGYPNPFAFNRMESSSSQTMTDLQMKQLAQANLNHRESLLLKQNQFLSGVSVSPLLQQQLQAAGNPNYDIQQQLVSNMLSRRHSLLAPNEQILHLDQKSEEVEPTISTMNRRNSAPAGQQRGGIVASSASGNNDADITQMSLEAIEDELLKVKEMKLLMMKRKLETQLEANEKE